MSFGHLGYWNRTNLAVLNLHVSPMPPTKFQLNPTYSLWANVILRFSRWPPWWPFWILEQNEFCNFKSPCHPKCLPPSLGSIRLTIQEQKWVEDFQDGHHSSHLGCWIITILGILNLYLAPMPPIKFWLNWTFGLEGDDLWWFSRWPTWWPSRISEWNDFSNSKSLCGPSASHQVWAHSDLGFRSRFSRWPPRWPSWIVEQNNCSNSESLCSSNVFHEVSAQSDFQFGRRYPLKNFKMAAVVAILDIGTERF